MSYPNLDQFTKLTCSNATTDMKAFYKSFLDWNIQTFTIFKKRQLIGQLDGIEFFSLEFSFIPFIHIAAYDGEKDHIYCISTPAALTVWFRADTLELFLDSTVDSKISKTTMKFYSYQHYSQALSLFYLITEQKDFSLFKQPMSVLSGFCCIDDNYLPPINQEIFQQYFANDYVSDLEFKHCIAVSYDSSDDEDRSLFSGNFKLSIRKDISFFKGLPTNYNYIKNTNIDKIFLLFFVDDGRIGTERTFSNDSFFINKETLEVYIGDDSEGFCIKLTSLKEYNILISYIFILKKLLLNIPETSGHPNISSNVTTSIEYTADLDTRNNTSPYIKLNNLIGLDTIKKDVLNLTNLMKMQSLRQQQGLKTIPVSLHLVFSGNPGTGKTTIARILADIYKEIGILSTGQLIEVDRSSLVAGYVGQTALKTQEKINEAIGGILFIDEAYTLAKGENDYGQEAIDTILKAMEDHRDNLIVIVAGYSDLMQKFVNSNPGLRSRFNKYIYFPDYTADQLIQIFLSLCKEYNFILTDEAKSIMQEKIVYLEANKDENFANARDIRNLFEEVITKQATRLAYNPSDNIMEITAEDFL